MATTIQDPSLQNVQPSNSGGASSAFSTQTNQPVSNTPANSQTNQGVTFNQTPSGSGQGQQSSTSSGRNKPQGTGFTNVNNILSANQGNNLGQTIQSGITNTAQNVQNNLGNAQSSFNQGVQANTFGTNDMNNVQNTINSASNLQAGQTVDPTQLSQFQTYTAGGYQGPTALQNANLLQGQAQQAEQLGQNVNTAGGQQNLLQRFVGNAQYGQGQQTLDQLLLGQQQGALNKAQAATIGLTNQANSDVNNASQIANQAVAGNQAFGQNAITSAQNAQNPINTNISNSITQDLQNQNQQQYQFNQLQNLLKETPQQFNQNVNALGSGAQSTGNAAVDQINSVLQGLSGLGVDNSTLQQLAGPALQQNINDIPGYLNQIMGATSLNNTNGLTVSNPSGTGSTYGTLNYQPDTNDVSSLANKNAVMSQSQAAQLNALSQLAGGTGNINASGVGTYNPNTVGVDLSKLLPPDQYNALSKVTPAPNPTTETAVGNTLAGIGQGYGNIFSNTVGSLVGDATNQGTDIANKIAAGDTKGALSNAGSAPVTVGTQLATDINQHPLNGVPVVGGLLGGINNPLAQYTQQPITIASNLASQIGNPIQAVSNVFGGGGKIICNELHRQGYISNKVIQLDEEFGKKYRRLNPDAYRGYLLLATPIVALMKRSFLFTKAISYISLPWSNYMANRMDNSIPGSNFGYIIHNVGIYILPKIFRINKFIKKVSNEYSSI